MKDSRGALRVVVVDDSPVSRLALRTLLEADADILVVAEANDGAHALPVIRTHRPDVATMDLHMAGVDGLSAIRNIMAAEPLPILVVTGDPGGPQGELALRATSYGALDVAAKPELADRAACALLRTKIRQLAGVPVVRHLGRSRPPDVSSPSRPLVVAPPSSRAAVIAIASSAGGPGPLAEILGGIPVDAGTSVLVVQHLPLRFLSSFRSFLANNTRLEVVVVSGPTVRRAGTVYVPAEDRHLVVVGPDRIDVSNEPPYRGHRPAANVLFQSVAAAFGARSIGVVLSGMGDDGARGLAEMARAGAVTIAQAAVSATVDGMPKAAREGGAARLVMTTEEIAVFLAAARANE